MVYYCNIVYLVSLLVYFIIYYLLIYDITHE